MDFFHLQGSSLIRILMLTSRVMHATLACRAPELLALYCITHTSQRDSTQRFEPLHELVPACRGTHLYFSISFGLSISFNSFGLQGTHLLLAWRELAQALRSMHERVRTSSPPPPFAVELKPPLGH